jgi:hypothetical protein
LLPYKNAEGLGNVHVQAEELVREFPLSYIPDQMKNGRITVPKPLHLTMSTMRFVVLCSAGALCSCSSITSPSVSRSEFKKAEARIKTSEARIKALESMLSGFAGNAEDQPSFTVMPEIVEREVTTKSALSDAWRGQLIIQILSRLDSGLLSRDDVFSAFEQLHIMPYLENFSSSSDPINYITKAVRSIEEPEVLKKLGFILKIELRKPIERRHTQSTSRTDFPWPPPIASSEVNIPLSMLKKPVPLKEILSTIGDTLTKLQYSYKVYPLQNEFVQNGFVVVTDLEPFSTDGKHDGDKSNRKPKPASELLVSYMKALLLASPGRYRFFCIAVAPPVDPSPLISFSSQNAKALASHGGATLPAGMGEHIINEEYSCTAFVYEFEKKSTEEAGYFIEHGKDANFHLINSGIFTALVPSAR